MAIRKNKDIKKKIKFRFKYPKFLILIFTIILGFFVFKIGNIQEFENFILSLGYFGSFFAGILFSHGFTAAPATAIFLIFAKSQNIWLCSLFGAFGVLIGDLLIFKLIRISFQKEINYLERERIIKWVEKEIPEKIRHYLLVLFADLILITPLPNELGITMLASYNKISIKFFSILSYVLGFLGILAIMLIGKSIF